MCIQFNCQQQKLDYLQIKGVKKYKAYCHLVDYDALLFYPSAQHYMMYKCASLIIHPTYTLITLL